MNGFKNSECIKSSIWPIDGILKNTTNVNQTGPGICANERVVYIT